ncbi:MAG TPA: sterol-binding protein [Thiolapillus brandeum]|uniref:Ubiquinone biosynthesis accessory factor UbiT n=1 Tax=Thiolapillus brandeum TaxID=1076588 RepID=A0A7C5N007_9GAMM|nr:sterol-binding protein [Thiolapillus brandeum]
MAHNGIIAFPFTTCRPIMPLPVPPIPAPPVRKLLQLPGRVLPPALHAHGLSLLLNRIFREALARGELWFLENRVLQVEVTDLALDYRLTLENGRLTAASPGRRPDVRFGGSVREFLVLALGREDPDTLFFQRRLQLEGDTELGLEIKNFLYSLEQGLLPEPMERLLLRLV